MPLRLLCPFKPPFTSVPSPCPCPSVWAVRTRMITCPVGHCSSRARLWSTWNTASSNAEVFMYKIQPTSKTEYKKKWKYLINNFVWHAEMILFCITGLKYIKMNFTCCRCMRPLENSWLHMLLALYLWDTVLIHWGHQHAIILITCDQSLESTGLARAGTQIFAEGVLANNHYPLCTLI